MTRSEYEKLKQRIAKKQDPAFSHIEDAAFYLAQALNLLDAANNSLEMAFDLAQEWNDDVLCDVRDCRAKLGGDLAALDTWWDGFEDDKK